MSSLLLLAACAGTPTVTTPTPQAQPASPVSPARLQRLSRGVNLTFWFWSELLLEEVPTRFSDADLALLRDLGFRHVRVPFDMKFIYNGDNPDLLDPEALIVFDEQIKRIQSYDLAVIIDLHSTLWVSAKDAEYSAGLQHTFRRKEYLAFWQSLAAHLNKTTNPDMLFIEIMNEPGFWDNPQQWYDLQQEAVTTIRAQAPQHTIIVTAAKSSWLTELVEMQPLDDLNLVYNFHFYEPFQFTHQGANWADEAVLYLHDVPYPADSKSVAPLLKDLPQVSRDYLNEYGKEQWNAERIQARIREASKWSQKHGVPVICTEFGAFKTYADAKSRIQWHQDTRMAFEKFGIGWTLFEYESNFGLVTRSNGRLQLDQALALALGLNVK